jgi:hypothetical protein
MKLNSPQLDELLGMLVTTKVDSIGCDGCAELMDQFAQMEIDNVPIPDRLKVVAVHIEQCKCCRDEYAALMTALRAIAE